MATPPKQATHLSYAQQRVIMIQHFEQYLYINCPHFRGALVDILWKGSVLKVKVPAETAVPTVEDAS